MKTFSGAILAALLLASPAYAVAEGPGRVVEVKLPTLSDVETGCIDQLKYNWGQPGAYDETFKSMILERVVHRKDGEVDVIVFQGHAHNYFLQEDRAVTVTCRPGNKKPYPVSFQIDR
jgi:hypothetical protein